MGVVESLSVLHSVIRESEDVWAPPNHAPHYLDIAYYRWLLLRRDNLIAQQRAASMSAEAWVRLTPDDLASRDAQHAAQLRMATQMQEDGIARWAEGHDLTCTLLDDCNIVVGDGNHKGKWPCCKFDDVRYVEIPDVAQVPFGCEHNRLMQSDVCAFHVRYVGRHTPAREGDDDEREIKDYCRADGLAAAIARRVARRAQRREGTKHGEQLAESLTSAAFDTQSGAAAISAAPSAVAIAAPVGEAAPSAATAPQPQAVATTRAVAAKRARGAARSLANDDNVGEGPARGKSKVDKAVDKIVAQRAKRSAAVEKLDRARTLNEQVLLATKRSNALEASKPSMGDVERYDTEFPHLRAEREEYLEGGTTAAWHGLGDNAYLVEKIVGRKTMGLVDYHAVKFVGWKKPTWEPSHSNLQKEHVDAYEAAVARGESEVCILPMDEAMKPNPNLPADVVTMSMTRPPWPSPTAASSRSSRSASLPPAI